VFLSALEARREKELNRFNDARNEDDSDEYQCPSTIWKSSRNNLERPERHPVTTDK
jgi:hypothetical protein